MKTNRFILLSITFIFLVPFILWGNPGEKMDAANAWMQKKAYDEAIAQYKQILSEDKESVSLYNNLGLACYHTGRLPEAVLYFEKALKQSPGNQEVRHNLEVVNAGIDSEVYELEKFFVFRWWESFYLSMHPDFFAVMTLVLIFVFLLAMFVMLFRKRTKLLKPARWIAIFSALLVILFFSAAMKATQMIKSGDARILMEEVSAFEKPEEGSEQTYLLKAGSKVRVKESQDGWLKLELINRDTCWVKNVSMEKI